MPTSTEPLKVFLSYGREDQATAHLLYEVLSAEGLEVWFDQANLVPGASWNDELNEALYSSNAVVVLIGHGASSPSLQREAEVALEHVARSPSAQVIPLLLPGSHYEDVPFGLRQFPVVDLRSEPLGKKGFMRVAARLSTDPDQGGPPEYELVGDRLRES